jgi:hypothetical protein
MWIAFGLARIISRRELQHQQTIGMLNTIYSTQASQRSTLEKMQMDLNAISARLGSTAADGGEAMCLWDQRPSPEERAVPFIKPSSMA